MSGLGHRRGVLTAGGHAVHKVSGGERSREDEEPVRALDQVPLVERYQELSSRHMHRVAVLPRRDRFLMGCNCGWVSLSESGISEEEARLVGARHPVDEAKKMMQKLEGMDEHGG